MQLSDVWLGDKEAKVLIRLDWICEQESSVERFIPRLEVLPF